MRSSTPEPALVWEQETPPSQAWGEAPVPEEPGRLCSLINPIKMKKPGNDSNGNCGLEAAVPAVPPTPTPPLWVILAPSRPYSPRREPRRPPSEPHPHLRTLLQRS